MMYMRKKGRKRLWGFLLFIFIQLFPSGCTVSEESKEFSMVFIEVYKSLDNYVLTNVSKTMEEVVKERLGCFGIHASLGMRLEECRKNYVNQIIKTARVEVVGTPLMGGFVICLKHCPISFALCKGEGMDIPMCINKELLCIEYCLNNFWRGGKLPKDNDMNWD